LNINTINTFTRSLSFSISPNFNHLKMSLRTLSSSSKKLARTAATAATRSYATSASADYSVSTAASGVKVAALDDGSPTSAITVAVKAGPRYEPAPGLAHVLKNSVFKVGLLVQCMSCVHSSSRPIRSYPASSSLCHLRSFILQH
jgi:hypothetical protein